jgi:serine/threonine-protein kinase RsbW
MINTGMEIRAKSDRLPLLLNFLGNSMLKFGLGEYQQFQVQMAVDEAVKNIIKCGKLNENDKISVNCQKQDNEVKILIKYPGKSFNPAIAHLKQDNNCLKVYFTRKNMNKVNHEFEDAKNVLTLIKSF